MTLLVAFFAALSAAIVAVTFFQTMAVYPSLTQFPLHLDWKGRASGLGPRGLAFLVPGIQVFVAAVMAVAGYAIATGAPGAHGNRLSVSIIGVCMAALTWRVQMLLIESARSGGKPVPMRGFWLFFVVWIVAVEFVAFGIY